MNYLAERFSRITNNADIISTDILSITKSHPFYTQQLAFSVFELLIRKEKTLNIVEKGVEDIIRVHDMDYERLLIAFNRTDIKVLIGMSQTALSPLSSDFLQKNSLGSSSTIFSSLKRLSQKGIVIKARGGYEIDDPFFSKWIIKRRLS